MARAKRRPEKVATKGKGHGGRRPGAGRPPTDRHLNEYDAIGPPPASESDPIARCTWAQRIAALALWRVAKGDESAERAQRIFQGVNTVVRAVPMERLKAAEDALEEDAEELEETAGPRTVAAFDAEMPLNGPPPRTRPR